MKKFDVVVTTGEYTDSQGQTKKRYKNVGVVLDKGNGPFLVLDRTFNPAGLPNPENDSRVILSLFAPKANEQQYQQAQQAAQQAHAPQESSQGFTDDSSIPW